MGRTRSAPQVRASEGVASARSIVVSCTHSYCGILEVSLEWKEFVCPRLTYFGLGGGLCTLRCWGRVRVDHLPCGAFANASEEAAFRAVVKYLRALPHEGRAFVLTNLAHGVGRGGQPDEIDMIVIALGGEVVIEVKHWDRARLKANVWEVEDQADLITLKAKRVASRLRQAQPKLEFVSAKMLLTKEAKSLRQSGQLPEVRGVRLHGLGCDLKRCRVGSVWTDLAGGFGWRAWR